MRVIYHIILHVAFALMLVSCLSEPHLDPVQEVGIPINFDASINHTQTKVNAQGFEDGDALGLYAVNYEGNNTIPGTLKPTGNQADHVKYVFDESMWTWKPVHPVYYYDINTNVDIYAFYPYDEPASVSAHNFEVQKDQNTPKRNGKLGGYEASDFLWGKTENVAPTESAIKVRLDHMMSGVHVILKEGTGFDAAGDFSLIEKTVLVTNTTRKASINISNGIVTPVGGAQATGIVMAKQSDGTFRAVVVPQTIPAGSPLFNITVGGVAYDFMKDNAYEYLAGKLSQFTITVNRKMPSGEYELVLDDTQIVDWKEDINDHEGEARQYYCVHCDEPGTLGRLIKEDRKNPDKIRNLKVSGTIQASDFYFMRDSMALLQSINLKEAKVFDAYAYTCYGGYPNFGRNRGFVTCYFNESKTLSEIQEVYPYVDDIYEVRENVSEIPEMAFWTKSDLVNFVFPEKIERIGFASFFECNVLAGDLIIPDGVKIIDDLAFSNCGTLSALLLPEGVEVIGEESFYQCLSLSGQLLLPDSITHIKSYAFGSCSNLSGSLILPNNISIIGEGAFSWCKGLSGDLKIPETLTTLECGVFEYCNGLNGQLVLHDNLQFVETESVRSAGSMFLGCSFQGELKLPKSLNYIPKECFAGNAFSSIVGFPEDLIAIGERAFQNCSRLQGNINLPESLVSLGERAFAECVQLQGVVLPSNLSVIGAEAFAGCSYLNNLRSMSSVPPAISSGAFDGVAKDNFTVEVPHNAVALYRSDPQWSEFKRITPYYDFSLDRSLLRALNSAESRTHILRVPAGQPWSIESKPDWITVEPSNGIGKTEITITFQELRSEEADYIPYDYNVDFMTTRGRVGEIVFLLNDKDHRINVDVEQFDYQYDDGSVLELNRSTKGNGVDIVFLADGFDAREIASDKYMNEVRQAYEYFFDIEPYKSYKDYFDVYAVIGVSKDSGIGTVNTIRDVKFGSQYSPSGISIDSDICYEYARKVYDGIDLTQTLIVLVQNTTDYSGQTFMSVDGSAIACCPKSRNEYPYDFRGIVQHEAGGHGFGKLADENIYFNTWIQNTSAYNGFMLGKSIGWYKNLDVTSGVNEVGWSHLIFNPKYSATVDVFEGGYYYSRGIYRSESTSCMNNNIPYYSAISRQAIVERIMEYAGEPFDLDEFLENDVHSAIIPTKSSEDMTLSYQQNTRHYSPVIIRN